VADRPGSAYSVSNEAYLLPIFAIAWTPIRINGISRMSMAMGNRKTTARVGPSTTPRRCTSMRALTFEKLTYITPGPPPPISATSISTTVTPLITAGDSTPRRLLTNDDRRRMFEYHESHPGVKQIHKGEPKIAGAHFGTHRSRVSVHASQEALTLAHPACEVRVFKAAWCG